MANFTTHIAVGTVVAGTLATLTLAADVVAPENLVAVTMAGLLGSVLPDIDLKESRPSRAMFAGLAIFFSFAVLFTFATRLSVLELWIVWLGTMAFIRYGLHTAFHRLTVHRGIWHSLMAGLFCAAATAIVFRYVLLRHEGVSWLAGGFLFAGYLTHLILDEMYSVDVMGRRIKASFGTAVKVFDRRYPGGSAAMAVALVAAVLLAPSPQVFVEGMTSREMWTGLQRRMLPQDQWFGIRVGEPVTAGGDRSSDLPVQGSSPVTTGSIPHQSPGTAEPEPSAAR